jgi:DNA-binding transcriptional regulator PaaX
MENVNGEEYPHESLSPSGISMTIHHKYYGMKYLSESVYITPAEKEQLILRTFLTDNSDSTIRFRKLTAFRMPDAELKEQLWQSCSDLENNTTNYQEYRHACSGFTIIPQHYNLVEKYFDKYYEILPKIIESTTIS